MEQQKKNTSFYTLLSVFFFWGFVAASNGIFIPFCKSHFNLTQFQSQLIDSAFYGAYFFGSFFLWLYSQIRQTDLINSIGYKKGTIYGLLMSVLGAAMMLPAVQSGSFGFILFAFFIIAFGFSLQQTCVQPFVIAMGNVETGSHRLNLGGAINSFGTLLGPVIVSAVLFGDVNANAAKNANILSIKELYIILGVVLLLAAFLLNRAKLPKTTNTEKFEPGLGALKFPQLRWGMLAIFIYVGVEVAIQSNMGALLKTADFGSIDEAGNSKFISLYWGSLMIGRWTGAIGAFSFSKTKKYFLTIVIPIIAFCIIMYVNYFRGNNVSDLYTYIFCVFILIAAFFISAEKPARTLLIFGILGMSAMVSGMLTTGEIACYSFISGGLCCSIMWPCIFSLSISGLGKYTNQGSAFLIMMILGGAVIPPLQGFIADKTTIHFSYIVTIFCFAYLAFFAMKVKQILKEQGIDHDAAISSGN